MSANAALPTVERPGSLGFWMTAVARECDIVRQNFAPVPVHDLRVALRRCRSIADGFIVLDPHPAWKLMKRESKRLFQQLGALRDNQVMSEWVQRLAPLPVEASIALRTHLEEQENRHREEAADSILEFNRKKWDSWERSLSDRTRGIPPENQVFQHLALERWSDMRALHREAIHNRSHAAYHRLRIAVKKFRYTIENFLPSQYEEWGADLKALQDALGEVHDLYVLWQTTVAIRALPDKGIRAEWRQRILNESRQRLQFYRQKMCGKTSLLLRWRAALPDAEGAQKAALTRLQVWASFRDPDARHSANVARLALQIYDGLDELDLLPSGEMTDARGVLKVAALVHAVGLRARRKKPQLASYRMIRKLKPPLGLSSDVIRGIALVARFHRGRLPRSGQKAFAGLSEARTQALIFLSGILRLADALDRLDDKRVYRLQVGRDGDSLRITVPGYLEYGVSAERLAAARHLLEVACRLPILFR